MEDAAAELTSSYDEAFVREREGGSFYASFDEQPAFIAAAHDRRMALLDEIDLGDLSEAWSIDYGCGSWGFAAVFPKLRASLRGTGIDISRIALDESRLRVAADPSLAGRVDFLQSTGDHLDLPDGEVDVFFAGESIEHVVVTHAFLDEVHRVLRPGGSLILTTPNADALTYRATGQRFAIGPEHVALMTYRELLGWLEPAFEVRQGIGFNASYLPSLDASLTDQAAVRAWTSQYRDRPEDATCVIVVATPRTDYTPQRWAIDDHHHSAPDWHFEERREPMVLHGRMTGRALLERDLAVLRFTGEGVVLLLWSHAWSGEAAVSVDGGDEQLVELFSPAGGFMRLCFGGLDGERIHELRVRPTGRRHGEAEDSQVLVHAAYSYRACGA